MRIYQKPEYIQILPWLVLFTIFSILTGCEKEGEDSKLSKIVKENVTLDIRNQVGHFSINRIKFNIPRKYISFPKNLKDGNINAINLSFFLPDFSASPDSDKDIRSQSIKDSIDVLIKGCSSDNCGDMAHSDFISTLNVYGGNKSGCINGVEIYHKNLNLVSYIVRRSSGSSIGKEVFIKGDKCHPEYYLVCGLKENVPFPRCSRWYNYGQRILINYNFNKVHIEDYLNIEKKLNENIESFTIM